MKSVDSEDQRRSIVKAEDNEDERFLSANIKMETAREKSSLQESIRDIESKRHSHIQISRKRSHCLKESIHKLKSSKFRFWKKNSKTREGIARALVFLLYFGIGIMFYKLEEGWSLLDCCFFIIVTLSTIGYGNISPSTDMSRLFTIFYAISGIVYMLKLIDAIVTDSIHLIVGFIAKKLKQRGVLVANSFSEIRSEYAETHSVGHHFKKARRIKVAGIVVALLVVLLLGAAAFSWLEDWNFVEAFYFCCVTISTVGYGDYTPTSPQSEIFAIFFILVGVFVLANTVGTILSLQSEIKLENETLELLAHELDFDMLKSLNYDGLGIDRFDFTFGILHQLGVIDYERDVLPWARKFDEMDGNGDLVLTAQDIRLRNLRKGGYLSREIPLKADDNRIKVLRRMTEAQDAKKMEINVSLIAMKLVPHILLFLLFYTVGYAFYNTVEGWDFLSCVYFISVTILSIGYGDIVPSTNESRLFTAIYVLVGLSFVFTSLYNSFLDFEASLKILTKRWFPVRRGAKKKAVTVRELRMRIVRTIVIFILFGLGASLIFYYQEPDWSFIESLYCTTQTLLTIGYGDYIPNFYGSMSFMVVFMWVGVILASFLVSDLANLKQEIRLESLKAKFLSQELTGEFIQQFEDLPGGLGKVEYVVFVLNELEVIDYLRDVAHWYERFDELDTDCSGKLDEKDIDMMATIEKLKTQGSSKNLIHLVKESHQADTLARALSIAHMNNLERISSGGEYGAAAVIPDDSYVSALEGFRTEEGIQEDWMLPSPVPGSPLLFPRSSSSLYCSTVSGLDAGTERNLEERQQCGRDDQDGSWAVEDRLGVGGENRHQQRFHTECKESLHPNKTI